MIGKTILHYKIIEKLGQGGMGVVYKAEDTRLQRTVALKFLPPEFTRDTEAKERFIREARAASSLEHTNICNIHEIDETEDGQLFFVMACYEGESLRDQIGRGPLQLERALDIAIQIAHGLAKAHDKGIVHRDIKSANVFITVENVAKILDFGLAKLGDQTKLTREHTTLGTVAYMSPEQIRGEDVDVRSDIWSLGVVLYEMITGQLPFKGEYEQAVTYSILSETPEPITGMRTGVPIELERITNKAMAKDANERYQHVDEMLVDLKAVRHHLERGETRAPLKRNGFPQKKKFYLYSGIVLFVALAILIAVTFLPMHRGVIDSIAVLPLENPSGNPEQNYFANGMTEALITELQKIKALKVISRQSVMQFKDSSLPLGEIAKKLGVDAVVEGSTFHEKDMVRIDARLIDAATDRLLWAKDYERDIRNVLSLWKEVARAIAREINIQVMPQDEKRIGKARAVDPEAFILYLKGSQAGGYIDIEAYQQAISYLEQSISKDSTYAPAYVTLANKYILLGGYDLSVRDLAESKARQLVAKALDLDENLAEAHLSMALLSALYKWDWIEAEQSYVRTIELAPGSCDAHWEYGKFLAWMGNFEKGLAEMKYALELNPLSTDVHASATEIYLFYRHYDKAIESAKIVLEMEPNSGMVLELLAWAYLGKEMYGEAIATFKRAAVATANNPGILGKVGYAYAISGQVGESLKVLEEVRQRTEGDSLQWVGSQALINCGRGDCEEMLKLGEQAYELRWPWLILLKVHPMYDPLRSNPDFQQLMKKMHFN